MEFICTKKEALSQEQMVILESENINIRHKTLLADVYVVEAQSHSVLTKCVNLRFSTLQRLRLILISHTIPFTNV